MNNYDKLFVVDCLLEVILLYDVQSRYMALGDCMQFSILYLILLKCMTNSTKQIFLPIKGKLKKKYFPNELVIKVE